MSEIKTLKITSGEEIICKVEGYDSKSNTYTISSPMVLQIMQSQQGYGLGLIPWVHSIKRGEIEVKGNQLVVNPFDPDKEITDAYLSQVSGIQLAAPGAILHG